MPSNTSKMLPTLYVLMAPLISISGVPEPVPHAAKHNSPGATHDLTINHRIKYFVRKEP